MSVVIKDTDMPITVAEKLIKGLKKDNTDLLSDDDLEEIAVYLHSYYKMHTEGVEQLKIPEIPAVFPTYPQVTYDWWAKPIPVTCKSDKG